MNLQEQIYIAQQANEKKLAAEVLAPKIDIDRERLIALQRFGEWCKSHGVRCLPCVPSTAAAFIKHESAAGVPPDRIVVALQAIEALHDNEGLSNPIATASVRAELGAILNTPAPRSWPKADKLKFMSLPVEIKEVISKRARQDEVALRRAQEELAQVRKSIQQKGNTDVASDKETTE